MTLRALTLEDADTLRELWEEFEAAMPPPPVEQETWDEAWAALRAHIERGVALLAEDDGAAIGFVAAKFDDWGPTTVYVTDLYVRPAWQRQGVGKALLAAVGAAARDRGLANVMLDVSSESRAALRFYDRLGFKEVSKIMHVSVDTLDVRVGSSEAAESFGALHVQTDDAPRVETAVESYLPRVGRSGGASVAAGPSGWTRVTVEPFDREVQRKVANELSDRLGAVVVSLAVEDGAVVHFLIYERNRMVDEYLSMPEYYGELPPGDALALRANPTVVSRLTGADPARVRAVARTAATVGELPPAPELYVQIAELMGLQP